MYVIKDNDALAAQKAREEIERILECAGGVTGAQGVVVNVFRFDPSRYTMSVFEELKEMGFK